MTIDDLMLSCVDFIVNRSLIGSYCAMSKRHTLEEIRQSDEGKYVDALPHVQLVTYEYPENHVLNRNGLCM